MPKLSRLKYKFKTGQKNFLTFDVVKVWYYTSKVHKNINHTYKKRKSVTNYIYVLSGTMNALHIPDRCVILRQHYYYGEKNQYFYVGKYVGLGGLGLESSKGKCNKNSSNENERHRSGVFLHCKI